MRHVVYAVVDKKSANVMGEFERKEDAQALRDRLIAADPSVRDDVKIYFCDYRDLNSYA